MKKAVIYARYSSSRQREESIERQIEICMDYAVHNDMMIVGSYIDRKKTGKSDARPDFQKMIYDSSRHQFDVVLVWRYDRFARNMDDHAAYERILKKNNAVLISATEQIPKGAHSSIVKGVLLGSNEAYSVELAEKVMDGMYKSALKGQISGGQRPLGYKVIDKHLVVDEGEAPIVRLIFQRYSEGKSMAEITRELNEKGFKNSKGNSFLLIGMRRILTDKRYIGILLYKGEDIGVRIPAIVDKALFDSVQMQIEKNKKAPSRTKGEEEQYLLTTKLFCGICQSPMSGVSGTSKTKGRKYQYYACCARYKHHSCTKQYISKSVLESLVVDVVKKTLIQNNIHELAKAVVKCCNDAQDNGKLLRLTAELREVNHAIENLLTLIEAGRTTAALADRLDERETQKKQLEAEIAKEKILHRIPSVEEVTFFFENFIHGNIESPEYSRYLIDTLVNSVYLYDNDDGTQKMTVLLNVQNGQEMVTLDAISADGGSSNVRMVDLEGFEPLTSAMRTQRSPN